MMTCQVACRVSRAPIRLLVSPKHHSTRKNMDKPDVDCNWTFLYIWGSCANSHETMLRVPNTDDIRASGVGMHVCRYAEMVAKKGEDGSQCCGSA